jgi:uncharacterized membrane protein
VLYFLGFLMVLGVLPTAIAAGILVAIWRKLGRVKPFRAGAICFVLGVIPILFVMIFFKTGPFPESFNILVLLPTYGPAMLGILLLALGLARGLRGRHSDIRKVLSDVRHNRHH